MLYVPIKTFRWELFIDILINIKAGFNIALYKSGQHFTFQGDSKVTEDKAFFCTTTCMQLSEKKKKKN